MRNIISRWAPPKENDTEAYIRRVLSLSGIGGSENLLPQDNVSRYGRLSRLVADISCVECGIAPECEDTAAICNGYRLAFPENICELEENEYRDWDNYDLMMRELGQ